MGWSCLGGDAAAIKGGRLKSEFNCKCVHWVAALIKLEVRRALGAYQVRARQLVTNLLVQSTRWHGFKLVQ